MCVFGSVSGAAVEVWPSLRDLSSQRTLYLSDLWLPMFGKTYVVCCSSSHSKGVSVNG
jgi:hypothetical protein